MAQSQRKVGEALDNSSLDNELFISFERSRFNSRIIETFRFEESVHFQARFFQDAWQSSNDRSTDKPHIRYDEFLKSVELFHPAFSRVVSPQFPKNLSFIQLQSSRWVSKIARDASLSCSPRCPFIRRVLSQCENGYRFAKLDV